MIEINPKIIDPRVLEARVAQAMNNKGLINENSITISENLHRILCSIRQDFTNLSAFAKIRELPICSHRRFIGRYIVFMKRVFRKLTRWLFSAYYNQQNQFNTVVVRTLDDMIRLQEIMIANMENQDKNNES